jgi:filamentous hemagglutinin
MNKMEIRWDTDCSEIASDLLNAANGKGSIYKVTGKSDLKLFEYGKIESGMKYHEVFTDGRYVYDPRLSFTPVPKGDWTRMIKQLNPGAKIK